MSHPDKGGLLDRVAAFRLVESVWKGVFFCFFVVQRSMDGYLPSKRRRDHQAQKMSLFFFYIVIFSSVLKAHRLTLPHGLVARRPGIFGLTGCDVHRRRPGKPTTVTVLPKKNVDAQELVWCGISLSDWLGRQVGQNWEGGKMISKLEHHPGHN